MVSAYLSVITRMLPDCSSHSRPATLDQTRLRYSKRLFVRPPLRSAKYQISDPFSSEVSRRLTQLIRSDQQSSRGVIVLATIAMKGNESGNTVAIGLNHETGDDLSLSIGRLEPPLENGHRPRDSIRAGYQRSTQECICPIKWRY